MNSPRPAWKHVIGILGGLGPHAHVEFEALLLDATGKAIGREPSDQDYPSWLVSSIPATPDRTGALLAGGESPLKALTTSAERLASADFGVIPCNTAHAFLDELKNQVSLPLLDMIGETAERVISRYGRSAKVGLLAANGTLKARIYQQALSRLAPEASVTTPLDLPDGAALQERLVMEPIFGQLEGSLRLGGGIKSGAFRDPATGERLAEPLREAAGKLSQAGCEVVLTACTEIPLVLGREQARGVPLLDPMAVAAESAIAIALGQRDLPS